MKSKFYAYYPRRFSNEYTVIRVDSPADEKRLLDWYDGLHSDPANRALDRVTVKQLRAMASTERHARKYNQAFSGYCAPWAAETVDEFLSPAY
jgi:hypothetical protein